VICLLEGAGGYRKIVGKRVAGNECVARGIDGDRIRSFITLASVQAIQSAIAPAQVRGVDQRGASGVELGDKYGAKVLVCQLKGGWRHGKVGGGGVAGDIGVAVPIDRNGVGLIRSAAAEISGEDE